MSRNGPAIAMQHLDTVKLLLESGADIELGYKKIVTPLYLAAEHGYYEMVKLLLSHGANKNFTFFERPPAQIAEFNGHADVVELLSKSNFCQEIQGTDYITKYAGLCGEVQEEL